MAIDRATALRCKH